VAVSISSSGVITAVDLSVSKGVSSADAPWQCMRALP
jgi:hypothetical protein